MQYIRLFHDNSGTHASWFVSHVTVRDLQTREEYVFLLEDWLMATAEGGVERIVPLATPEEMREFNRILRLNFARLLHEEHLWLSAFDPASQRARAATTDDPCRAHFTRLQRVAVAFLVIIMNMLASALFYGRRVQKPGEVHGFLLGISLS